jgi:hypothetical protein
LSTHLRLGLPSDLLPSGISLRFLIQIHRTCRFTLVFKWFNFYSILIHLYYLYTNIHTPTYITLFIGRLFTNTM